MPMANLPEIMSALQRGGMAHDTPAVIISSSTTAEERIVETRLGTVAADAAAQGIGSPAIVIVGAVAAMRQQLLATLVSCRCTRAWVHQASWSRLPPRVPRH